MMLKSLMGATLLCASAMIFTGCHKHSYTVGTGGDTEAEAAYDSWESHWFFGTIGESELNVNEICPSGNATVKDKRSFLNGLVAGFTGIVWSPTTVTVYCGSGEAAAEEAPVDEAADEAPMDEVPASDEVSIRLTGEQMRRLAMNPATIEWARGVSSAGAAQLQAAQNAQRDQDVQIAERAETASF